MFDTLDQCGDRGSGDAFDEQPAVPATVLDLDWNRLEACFGRAPGLPWFDVLRKARVVVHDDQRTDRPSVAGLLTSGKDPTEHLPAAWIKAAYFRGTRPSSNDLVHEERHCGPAPDQIDAAIAFIMRFATATRPNRDSLYDLDAVHEAIVNAVAHRNYSIAGATIRLFLFTDRLEFYSPGSPPNALTLEEMPDRICTRNPLLVHFLSHRHTMRTGRFFIESRGTGVRKILEGGEAHSTRRPKYELFGEELRLTLWAKKA